MTTTPKAALARFPYESVEMNRVSDGVVSGRIRRGLVYAKVEVRVQNHRIGGVKILEHRNGRAARRRRLPIHGRRKSCTT